MKLDLLLQAETDVQEIYNDLEEAGDCSGDRFLEALERAFSFITTHPEIGIIYRNRYRRKLVTGYPYAVFYVNEPSRIVVGSVQDMRQDPERIASILKRLS